MHDIHADRIVIIDFGSQYTQLIARRIRECGVFAEILPYDLSAADILAHEPHGIILSGGPETTTDQRMPKVDRALFDSKIPILGICYGMQTMAQQLGGKVEASQQREFGYAEVLVEDNTRLLAEIADEIHQSGKALLHVWMSHGDKVIAVPEDFNITAQSSNCAIAVMEHKTKPWFGIQFHPEVTHTQQGARIVEHFVREVCQCEGQWTSTHIIDDAIEQVQSKVAADEQVLLALSGGVDSSVTAALLHKALGDRLVCLFVDNGLLRQGEREDVEHTFRDHFGIHLEVVDAKQQFLSALAGITDPEQKRQIIGKTFIDVFEAHAKTVPGITWLAQGTIYPDVIESAGDQQGAAHKIKSHHNVGGLPERMQLKLLEPLRECFKDEVRQIGLNLGLPAGMVYRHPFPGPGLAVRVLGEVKEGYLAPLRQADAIFMEELFRHDCYYQISQAFAVFLPVKAVGVVGDTRCYDYVIALRAVETVDFMTARAAQLPHELLHHVANRIVNEVTDIARVTYDISSKPPATIEWE